jgi:hypothetical protein
MNPVTRLYRSSRAFRVLLYLLSIPLTLFLWFLADESWENYTEVGNLSVLALFILYATYVAALDREEQAGRVLALCVGAQPAATKKPATMWPARYIWTYSCQSEQEREHPEGDDKTLPALQDPGNVDPPRSEKCQRARFAAS